MKVKLGYKENKAVILEFEGTFKEFYKLISIIEAKNGG